MGRYFSFVYAVCDSAVFLRITDNTARIDIAKIPVRLGYGNRALAITDGAVLGTSYDTALIPYDADISRYRQIFYGCTVCVSKQSHAVFNLNIFVDIYAVDRVSRTVECAAVSILPLVKSDGFPPFNRIGAVGGGEITLLVKASVVYNNVVFEHAAGSAVLGNAVVAVYDITEGFKLIKV